MDRLTYGRYLDIDAALFDDKVKGQGIIIRWPIVECDYVGEGTSHYKFFAINGKIVDETGRVIKTITYGNSYILSRLAIRHDKVLYGQLCSISEGENISTWWERYRQGSIIIYKVNELYIIREYTYDNHLVPAHIEKKGKLIGLLSEKIKDEDLRNLRLRLQRLLGAHPMDWECSFHDNLYVFKDSKSKKEFYFNPVRSIDEVLDDSAEANLFLTKSKGFYAFEEDEQEKKIIELSNTFLREEDEILELISRWRDRKDGSGELLDYYVDFDEEDEEYQKLTIVGAYTKGKESGMALCSKGSEWWPLDDDEDPFEDDDKYNFPRNVRSKSKEKRVTEYEFHVTLSGIGGFQIKPESLDHFNQNFEYWLVNKKWFINGCNYFREEDKVTQVWVYIRFYDINRQGSHASYIFSMSETQEMRQHVVENSTSLLEYIMYLKSVNAHYLEEERKKQAIKSALGTIMTRNMSHNFGSHFLHYTKEDLSNGVIGEDSIKGAAFSFAFLRDRMSYLASIMDEQPYPNLPVYLTTHIRNPLMGDGVRKNYYLDGIVRSEGYKLIDQTLQIEWSYKNPEIILSIPGGTTSAHAFYNILENFIRNSAKYDWESNHVKNLKITICADTDYTQSRVKFIIYDNKDISSQSKQSLVEVMHNKLISMQFLGNSRELDDDTNDSTMPLENDYEINKDNKGLKEMLISALWLNINGSNRYSSLKDVLYDWEISSKTKRQNILDGVGIDFIERNHHLGIQFSVPMHLFCVPYQPGLEQSGANADVVVFRDKEEYLQHHSHFTRSVLDNDSFDESLLLEDTVADKEDGAADKKRTSYLYQSICSNYPKLDNIILSISTDDENKMPIREPGSKKSSDSQKAKFSHHLANKVTKTDYNSYKKLLYVDSGSGMNYTSTLLSRYRDSIVTSDGTNKYKKWIDKYYSLLIKESALTKITIIDERICERVKWMSEEGITENGVNITGTQLELDLRNIRVLNHIYCDASNKSGLKHFSGSALVGSNFREVVNTDDNRAHFISIHLGIIEKIIKNEGKEINKQNVEELLLDIKHYLNSTEAHVCIHSGRGTVSNELKDAIDGYPLMPFSTLESMLSDSKFMLCQVLYSNVY